MLLKSTSEILLFSVFWIVILWGISKAKVIQMNHQSDQDGLNVENPLELQMLFGEKIFLDPNDVLMSIATINAEEQAEQNNPEEAHLPIAIYLELEKTLTSGVKELPVLMGKILSITQLDGKIPTMELAEILDLTNISIDDFIKKIKNCRKVIVFSDNGAFHVKSDKSFQLFDAGEISVLLVPSIMQITGNMDIKKEFAQHLKEYFLKS